MPVAEPAGPNEAGVGTRSLDGTAATPPLMPPPTGKATLRVVAMMVAARLGVMLALATPLSAGLALKLQTLVAPGAVVGALGVVTSLGALAGLLFDPVFGRISDRTTGRFGRRRPWLIVGSAGLFVALVIIAVAPNLWVLGLGWVFGQILGNAAVAAHTASIADQLPQVQRGRVSGAIGVAQQAAGLGAAYAAQLFGERMLLLFLVPGVIGVVLVTVYAFVLPDKQLPQRPRGEGGLLLALKTFWVNPVQHPDFAFAWGSRFLLVLANFMFVTFRLLWIQHEMGLTAAQAAEIMSTGVLCYTISLIVASQLAGWLSDRVRRRKLFIIASAVVFGIGMYVLTHADAPGAFYFAEVILGIGFGVYIAVDLALVLDVLPNPDEAGKDLAVFNIAMTGPQVLAPGVAAWLIGVSGGTNYDLMLIMAAVIALVGAALIIPIRSVR